MTLRDPLFAPRITRPEHPDDSIALVSAESPAAVPLSILSEDEQLFRESITDFANREVRPLTRQMDEAAVLDPALLQRLFSLGVMGVEVPEALGGSGGSFFHAV